MSLGSDPLDLAFGPEQSTASTTNQDPLDLAFGPSSSIQGTHAERSLLEPGTPLAHFAAIGETALSGITAGAGSLADAVTGSEPGSHNWGYRPRTAEGKA